MQRKFFLSRANLWYIIIMFSTAAVFILKHRQVTGRLSRFHLIAYWLINAVAFFEAWQIINMKKDSFLYRKREWIRKVVSAIILPLAVIVSNVLFPYLLEGHTWPGWVVIILFCILGIVVGAHGFLGTLDNLDTNYIEADQKGAASNQKICVGIISTIFLLISSTLIVDVTKQGFLEIFEDSSLTIGACLVFVALLITFIAYPYVIKSSIASSIKSQKTTT